MFSRGNFSIKGAGIERVMLPYLQDWLSFRESGAQQAMKQRLLWENYSFHSLHFLPSESFIPKKLGIRTTWHSCFSSMKFHWKKSHTCILGFIYSIVRVFYNYDCFLFESLKSSRKIYISPFPVILSRLIFLIISSFITKLEFRKFLNFPTHARESETHVQKRRFLPSFKKNSNFFSG